MAVVMGLLFCSWLGGRRRLSVLHSTFIAEIAALLSFLLAPARLAMLVGFFLGVTGGLFDLTFNAHFVLRN